MKYQFLLLYDRVASQNAPGYNNLEISTFLTLAQDELVKSRYSGFNKYKTGFEATEKRRKDLGGLIKYVSLSPSSDQTETYPYGVMFDLPSTPTNKCMFPIQEMGTIYSTDPCIGNANSIPIKPVTHDQYNANINNPFKKPYSDLIWRIDSGISSITGGLKHQLIGDSTYQIVSYQLRYIKQPLPIVIPTPNSTKTIEGFSAATQLDCELDSEVHNEVISMAVSKATGITQQQIQYQIINNEQVKNE